MKRRALAVVRLGRPHFLIGGLICGGIGTAIASYERGSVDWRAYALAQATITSLHAMTHYANDYFDVEADALAVRTPFSGGSGILVAGAVPRWVALAAALALGAAGLAGAGTLAWLGLAPAATFAIAIAAGAWGYSAPPLRLLARGLGEIDTALVVAVLVPACAYAAQAGWPGPHVAAALAPSAAAMFAMMIAVEYPDVAADEATGKRNLVVRFAAAHRFGYAAIAALAAGVALAPAAGAPRQFLLVGLAAAPWAAAYVLALRARAWKRPGGARTIAGLGVGLFVTVAAATLVVYASAPRP